MTASAEQDALYRAMVDDGIIAAGQAAELPAKRAEDAAWTPIVLTPAERLCDWLQRRLGVETANEPIAMLNEVMADAYEFGRRAATNQPEPLHEVACPECGTTIRARMADQPPAAPPPRLCITVHGTPAPQGSKRHVGGGRMIESSKLVKPWREAVSAAVLNAFMCTDWDTTDGYPPPLEGPVSIEVIFTVAKPASAPKRRVTWPQRKPDLDKLVRSTFDAISDAGVWRDDAQVVELHATKCYPAEGVDALPHPGAVIRIWQIGGGA